MSCACVLSVYEYVCVCLCLCLSVCLRACVRVRVCARACMAKLHRVSAPTIFARVMLHAMPQESYVYNIARNSYIVCPLPTTLHVRERA